MNEWCVRRMHPELLLSLSTMLGTCSGRLPDRLSAPRERGRYLSMSSQESLYLMVFIALIHEDPSET